MPVKDKRGEGQMEPGKYSEISAGLAPVKGKVGEAGLSKGSL